MKRSPAGNKRRGSSPELHAQEDQLQMRFDTTQQHSDEKVEQEFTSKRYFARSKEQKRDSDASRDKSKSSGKKSSNNENTQAPATMGRKQYGKQAINSIFKKIPYINVAARSFAPTTNITNVSGIQNMKATKKMPGQNYGGQENEQQKDREDEQNDEFFIEEYKEEDNQFLRDFQSPVKMNLKEQGSEINILSHRGDTDNQSATNSRLNSNTQDNLELQDELSEFKELQEVEESERKETKLYQSMRKSDWNVASEGGINDSSIDIRSRKITEYEFINEIQPKNIEIKINKYVKSYFFGVGQYVIDIDIKRDDIQNKRLSGSKKHTSSFQRNLQMKLGGGETQSIDEFLGIANDNSTRGRVRAGSGSKLDKRGSNEQISYPTLQVKRSNDDFWAFDTALRNKFKLLRFPDFPRVGYSAAFKGAKISEQRVEAFQKLFHQILGQAEQHETLRPKILTMLFKFLIQDSRIMNMQDLSQSQYKRQKSSDAKIQHNKDDNFDLTTPHHDSQDLRQERQELSNQIGALNTNGDDSNIRKLSHEDKFRKRKLSKDRSLSPVINTSKAKKIDMGNYRGRSESFGKGCKVNIKNVKNHQLEEKTKSDEKDSNEKGNSGAVGPDQISVVSPSPSKRRRQDGIEQARRLCEDELQSQFNRQKENIKIDSLGKIFLKLPDDWPDQDGKINTNKPEWQEFEATFRNGSQLLLMENIIKPHFLFNYIIYRCLIEKTKEQIWDPKSKKMREIDVLMIYNRYDTKPILITIPQIFNQESEDNNEQSKLRNEGQQMVHELNQLRKENNLRLLDEIQQVITANSQYIPHSHHEKSNAAQGGGITSQIDLTNRYPVGKISVEVKDIQHFRWENEHQNIYVRITCNPYKLYTRRRVCKLKKEQLSPTDQGKFCYTLQFRQKFYIPIHNYYNTLKIEVVNQMSSGMFFEKQNEVILASYDIRLPDLQAIIEEDKWLNGVGDYLRLPLDESVDYKGMKMKPIPLDAGEKDEQAVFLVRIHDLTSFETLFMQNPNHEIIEERVIKEAYSIEQIKTVLARIKKVIYYLNWFTTIDTFIYQFHYPKFSQCAYVFIILFIFFYNSQYLLSYLLLLLILVVYRHSKSYEDDIAPWFHNMFFSDEHKHELMRKAKLNEITKQEEINFKKALKQQKLLNEEQDEELMQLQQEYGINQTKWLYGRYKDMKKGSAWTLNFCDKYCDYFEKYKNLLKWEDALMTKFFITLLCIAFVVVTYLPLRLIIALGFTYRFYRGRHWNARRQRNNQEICKMELQFLFDELKIDLSKRYNIKDHHGGIPRIKPLDELEWSWDTIIKAKRGLTMHFFEKQFIQQFQFQFKIYFPSDILRKECKSPKQLVSYFGRTQFVLRPRVIHDDDKYFSNKLLYRKPYPLYMRIPTFVMNKIPSDIYRVKNNKFEIIQDKQTGKMQVKHQVKKNQTKKKKGKKDNDNINNIEEADEDAEGESDEERNNFINQPNPNTTKELNETQEEQATTLPKDKTVRQKLKDLNMGEKQIRNFRSQRLLDGEAKVSIKKIEQKEVQQVQQIKRKSKLTWFSKKKPSEEQKNIDELSKQEPGANENNELDEDDFGRLQAKTMEWRKQSDRRRFNALKQDLLLQNNTQPVTYGQYDDEDDDANSDGVDPDPQNEQNLEDSDSDQFQDFIIE